MVDITGGDESTCLVNFLNIVLPGTWCSKASSTCSCTLHDDYVLYVCHDILLRLCFALSVFMVGAFKSAQVFETLENIQNLKFLSVVCSFAVCILRPQPVPGQA